MVYHLPFEAINFPIVLDTFMWNADGGVVSLDSCSIGGREVYKLNGVEHYTEHII